LPLCVALDIEDQVPSGDAEDETRERICDRLLIMSSATTRLLPPRLDADPMRRAADIIGGQIAAAIAGKNAEVVQLEASRRKN
jgi:hypothetical protein